MSQKVGRPKKEESKNARCIARLTSDDERKLNELCFEMDLNKSEMIAFAIRFLHKKLRDSDDS